jgi:ABC-type uncharacterized transport system ATPase component
MINDTENLQLTIDSIDYITKRTKSLFSREDFYNTQLTNLKQKVEDCNKNADFIEYTKGQYSIAVDCLYQESIGALEKTLNSALQYIMYDKNYTIKMELADKRGTKVLDLALVDNDECFEVDLKDGVGQGVRAIISSVLKLYYLMNKGSKILLLDEKYSALSAHYIPRFFEFLHNIVEQKDFILVMITHDERFMDYADKGYAVNDGNVLLIDNGENKNEK